jgi:hypothetical protein
MVENELVKALMECIEEAVKDYRLPVKNGVERAPRVINGYLPPKRTKRDEDDFPFIVVRAEGGTCNSESTETQVSIIIGCYSQEVVGHEYCINVMTRIKEAITSLPNGTLAKRYVLEYPITWDMVADQPYPQWQLDMSTKWLFQTPIAQFGYLDPNEEEVK